MACLLPAGRTGDDPNRHPVSTRSMADGSDGTVQRPDMRSKTAGGTSLGGLGCRWATIVGPAAPARKGACPRLHPPSYPHERTFTERPCGPCVNRFRSGRRVSPSPGRRDRIQRWSGSSSRPSNGSSASRRQPSRSTQSASDATDRRPGDPDRRLLHAAEEGPEAELAGALEHPLGRPDAAALGQLHVDARDDADERVEVLGRTQLSSATIGSDDRSWSQARSR